MPDTTPNTEQKIVSAPPVIVDGEAASNTDPAPQPQEEQEATIVEQEAPDEEPEEPEEPEEVPRTEFMNLKEALMMGQKQLARIPHINPESLRRFLTADLYPILIEMADYSNWYVGDLHNRVMGLEMGENDGYGGESLLPETAEQLINFIGMSLQIFGVILQSPKADPRLIQTAQLLTTQAPGLIAKVQDITMSDEPEDDEDYEDEEDEEDEEDFDSDNEQSTQPTEVLEPRKREPVQIATPAPEAEAEAAKEPVVDEKPTDEPVAAPDAESEEGKSDG